MGRVQLNQHSADNESRIGMPRSSKLLARWTPADGALGQFDNGYVYVDDNSAISEIIDDGGFLAGKFTGTTNMPEINYYVREPSNAMTVAGITQANPAVVSIDGTHRVQSGDYVTFASIVGMTELNDISGTHDGANDASVLSDSGLSLGVNDLVGAYLFNTTDGSFGAITANTATTITATLAGGTENDWDTGDAYEVRFLVTDVSDETFSIGVDSTGFSAYTSGGTCSPDFSEFDNATITIAMLYQTEIASADVGAHSWRALYADGNDFQDTNHFNQILENAPTYEMAWATGVVETRAGGASPWRWRTRAISGTFGTAPIIKIAALEIWLGEPKQLKLSPAPSNNFLSGVVNAKDFGVATSNTATQNDSGLIAMRDAIVAAGADRHWDIYFDSNTESTPYQYTNNRWLFGVRNYTLHARGVFFENTSSSTASRDTRPLHNRNALDDTGDAAGNPTSFPSTYTFGTAGPGGRTITTDTAADAGNFAADDWVLLAGFEQQNFGGNPPNLRYFEYKKVVSAVAGTGVITFTEPLEYLYDEDWEAGTYSGEPGTPTMGDPRIISLERANYSIPVFAKIIGATWLPNTTSVVSDRLIVDGLEVILEDVTAPEWTCVMSRDVTTIRCKFETGEPDKLVRKWRDLDSNFGANNQTDEATLTNAVGVHHAILDGTAVHGQAELYPTQAVFRGVHFYGEVAQYGGIKYDTDTSGTPVYAHAFEDCVLYKQFGTGTDDQKYMVNNDLEWTFTVDSVPSAWAASTVYALGDRIVPTGSNPRGQCWECTTAGTSGGSEPTWPTTNQRFGMTQSDNTVTWTLVHSDIRVDADTTGRQVVQRLDYGSVIQNDDTNGCGVISSITHDGGSPGDYIIRGTFFQPAAADVMAVRTVQRIIDRGGNRIVGPPTNSLNDITAETVVFRNMEGVDSGRGVMQNGIVASTSSDQAGATKLLRGQNLVVTVGTAGDSVKLPLLINVIGTDEPASREVLVINSGANSLDIFPDYNDTILGKSANAAAALAANGVELFIAESTGLWIPAYGNVT